MKRGSAVMKRGKRSSEVKRGIRDYHRDRRDILKLVPKLRKIKKKSR
jgi:hypothetical protein